MFIKSLPLLYLRWQRLELEISFKQDLRNLLFLEWLLVNIVNPSLKCSLHKLTLHLRRDNYDVWLYVLINLVIIESFFHFFDKVYPVHLWHPNLDNNQRVGRLNELFRAQVVNLVWVAWSRRFY